MIEQYKPIKASDLDNSLISIERTVTRTNTSTEPSGAQYNYKAKLIETRTPSSSGEGSPVLYTTSNIQDSGGVVSNSEESGPTKDLVTVSDFKSSIATKASSSHNHSLSDVREFAGWSITQNSSKDIVFKVRSPKSWTAVSGSKFSTSNIYSVCYGNGKFVAVGAGGKIAYSYDGISWTAVNSPTTTLIRGICYGNGKFVAAGDSGKIAYSSNGITWSLVSYSSFSTYNFQSVCYGNGKYVVVGSSGKIVYSSDGSNWTLVSDSKFDTSSIYGICYGNGKFVAVGSDGKIAYSTDAVNWTLVAESRFDNSTIHGVCYGNGRFVAAGFLGAARSEVGTGWIKVSDSGLDSFTIYGICYGNGKYIAVGNKGKIAYSSDGVSWTLVSDSKFDTSSAIQDVCYGNGKFVAVGTSGKIAYSEVFH